MAARSKGDSSSFHEFVPLLFARNLAEAEFYKALLEDHDIPVLIEDANTESMGLPDLSRGVPVLVPDENLSDAEDILEQRSESEDEYDDEEEEEEDDDYDEDDEEYDELESLDPDEAELEALDDDDKVEEEGER